MKPTLGIRYTWRMRIILHWRIKNVFVSNLISSLDGKRNEWKKFYFAPSSAIFLLSASASNKNT